VLSVPALHKTGTVISIEFTILPLQDSSGAIVAMVAIIRDVTKRFQEIRTLKQKLAALSVKPTTVRS
jgi:hypothetical protein